MGWMLFEKRFTASATSSRDTTSAVLFMSSCLLSLDVCTDCTRLVHSLHKSCAFFALACAPTAQAAFSACALTAQVFSSSCAPTAQVCALTAQASSTILNHVTPVVLSFFVSMNPCSSSERFTCTIVWLLPSFVSRLSWLMETGNHSGQPSLFAVRNSRKYIVCSFASSTPALCSPNALSWSMNFTGSPSHFFSP